MKIWTLIFTFNYPGNVGSYVAISSRFVIARGKNSLVLYNCVNKTISWEVLNFQPWVLRFDFGENLLVTSTDGLHKYSLDDRGKLTQIWKCGDATGEGGIAFTMYRDIVVPSFIDKEICIISSQGLPVSYSQFLSH